MMVMGQKTLRYFLLALAISYIIGLFLFAPNDDAGALQAEETDELEDTTYPDIQIRTVSREDEQYKLYVQTPVFQEATLDQFFGDYVEQVMNQFFHIVEQKQQLNHDVPAELKLTVDIAKAGEGLYSIQFHEESYTGGATVNQKVKSWMVDLKEGDLFDRQSLFKDAEKAKDTVFTLIEKQLYTSEQYRDYILEAELEGWLAQTDYHFSNMMIDDGKAVFHFDQYEVLSGAAGLPEVYVPMQELEDLIKEEWLKRLELEDATGLDFYM